MRRTWCPDRRTFDMDTLRPDGAVAHSCLAPRGTAASKRAHNRTPGHWNTLLDVRAVHDMCGLNHNSHRCTRRSGRIHHPHDRAVAMDRTPPRSSYRSHILEDRTGTMRTPHQTNTHRHPGFGHETCWHMTQDLAVLHVKSDRSSRQQARLGTPSHSLHQTRGVHGPQLARSCSGRGRERTRCTRQASRPPHTERAGGTPLAVPLRGARRDESTGSYRPGQQGPRARKATSSHGAFQQPGCNSARQDHHPTIGAHMIDPTITDA